MNKRTKLYIGIMLVVSAFTTLFTFFSLCFKKKSALAALAALATAEGLIGLALIEDNKVLRRKSTAEVDAEIFGENEEVPPTILDFEIPKDEEASEEDFQ